MLEIRRTEDNRYVLPALAAGGRRLGTASAIVVGSADVTYRVLRAPVDNVPFDRSDSVASAWLRGSAEQLRMALARVEADDSEDELEAWLADFE
jgi:hypothetical protein